VLYNPSAIGATWSSLITSGGIDPCLKQASSLVNLNQTNLSVSGVSANGNTVYISGKSGALCSDANTACNPASLQSAGFSPAQANAMSCIAMTESSGNPNTPSSSTGACGTFQITQGNWNTAKLHQPPCSSSTSCNDPSCNMQTAFLLSQQRVAKGQSAYSDWTCANCNSKAQSCVNQYDPGH